MAATDGCDGGRLESEINDGESDAGNEEESGIVVILKPMVGSLSTTVWE